MCYDTFMAKKPEHKFNPWFASVLGEVGGVPGGWVVSEDEGLFENSAKVPDVLLDRPHMPPYLVECKFHESKSGDPVKDVSEKLGLKCSEHTTYIVGMELKRGAALRYPEGAKTWKDEQDVRDKFLKERKQLRWKLISLEDSQENSHEWPSEGWIEGGIEDFWESVSRTSASTEEIAGLSKRVTMFLNAAANSMLDKLASNKSEQKRIAEAMGAPGETKSGMRIAAVVWLDALLMMNELYYVKKRLRPDQKTVAHTDHCVTSEDRPDVKAIVKEWENVLGDNYQSIFKPAREALPDPGRKVITWQDLEDPFEHLFSAVNEVQTARLGKIASIGGEIFARVMQEKDRKNSAAFYTKSVVAEFLSTLTLPDQSVLPNNTEDWRIADFACGTGTLLRALYRRLLLFARIKGENMAEFHKKMIEENMCGLDISAIAAHLATTTIVTLFPEISYNETNIGMVKFGKDNNSYYAGSLEFLDISKKQATPLFDPQFSSVKGRGEGISRIKAENDSFSAVIMNPPYSRTRGGVSVADLSGISEDNRKGVQKRIRKIRKTHPSNGKAGLGSDFAVLADLKLADAGRLGMVLPMTTASQGSWAGVRKMFTKDFSDLILVSFARSSSGGKFSMSDDTNMGEMLLTATKGRSGSPEIFYVTLDSVFPSVSVASEIARAVWKEQQGQSAEKTGVLYVGGERVGEWRRTADRSLVWGCVGAKDLQGISGIAEQLVGGEIEIVSEDGEEIGIDFPTCQLSKCMNVGSSHDQIGYPAVIKAKDGKTRKGDPRGAFCFHEILKNEDYSKTDLSLWATDYGIQTSIEVSPTHYGLIRDKQKAKAKLIRQERTDLFIQRGMRWTSQKVMAARTNKKVLGGSGWAGLSHDEDTVKFAFTVWANSVFGFIAYWHQGGRQQGGRTRMQIGDIGDLRIPNFSDNSIFERAERLRSKASELFTAELQKANNCEIDENRKTINLAAAEILGIPSEYQERVICDFSEKWAKEPSVRPPKKRKSQNRTNEADPSE